MSSGGCTIYLGKYLRAEPLCHTRALFNFVRLPLFFSETVVLLYFLEWKQSNTLLFFFFIDLSVCRGSQQEMEFTLDVQLKTLTTVENCHHTYGYNLMKRCNKSPVRAGTKE